MEAIWSINLLVHVKGKGVHIFECQRTATPWTSLSNLAARLSESGIMPEEVKELTVSLEARNG